MDVRKRLFTATLAALAAAIANQLLTVIQERPPKGS